MNQFFQSVEFDAVALCASHLARLQQFYSDVLGFEVTASSPNAARLGPAGQSGSLVVIRQGDGAPPRPRATAGLFHVAFLYPDRPSLAQALRRVIDRGVPIGSADHGVSEAIYLADPEGNGIELYADRHPDEWPPRMADGQVAMYTEPLDVDALLAVAGDGPAGPPRIGHVHLSVADLGHAERFYGALLGMSVTQRSYPGALFLARDGYHHHVGANVWRSNRRAEPGALGLEYVALRVKSPGDLQSIVTRLDAAGHPYERLADVLTTEDLDGIRLNLSYSDNL